MRHITRGTAAGASLAFHIFVQDSASTAGAGKASVAFSSFACRYIRNGEAISGAITPEDITTIGTYAAPTANTNIRIKAVDNTNMIGVYEVQIHADWVNTTNTCKSLTIYLTATGCAPVAMQIPLIAVDQQDAVRGGMTALPNAAAEAAGGLYTRGTGAGQLDQSSNGALATVTTVNGLAANVITATAIAADAITAAKVAADVGLEIADAVWDEATAGHTTAGTTGKALTDASSAGNPWSALTSANTDAGSFGLALGSTIQTTLTTIDDFIDTEVTAIKTKTDYLPSATAGAPNGLLIAGTNSSTTFSAITVTGGISVGTTVTFTGAFTASNASNNVNLGTGAITAGVIAADAIGVSEFAAATIAAIADGVWDEVLTAAAHNVANSAGKRLRGIDAAFEVHSGTASAGGASSITLEATASATNDIYNGDRIVIVAGTGAQEHGIIVDYDGTTKVATMSKAWVITPDATSEYEVVPADVNVEAWNNTAATGDGDWAELQTDVDAILVDTAEIGAAGVGLTALPTALQNADALLNRDMSAVSDTNARSPLNALRFLRNKWSISGTTLTVTEEDDVTSAWTSTVTTNASADPVTGNDPA